MKPSKIGIFDSGLGGLFVLNSLLKKYPNCQYYYYADNKNMPFGNKTKEELTIITDNIVNYFESIKVDLIICACGTISTLLLNKIKGKYKTPILSIVDPAINYVNNNYNNTLVLSTVNTCNSNYFQSNLINKNEVIGLKDLAYIIENNLDYKAYLDTFLPNNNYDSIVLGCTHYPMVKQYLIDKYNCSIIDMGDILANSITLYENDNPEINLYFSDNNAINIKLINKILNNRKVNICQNLPK